MERAEAERERERISGVVAARKVPNRGGGDRGRGRGRGRGAFGGSGAGGPLGDGGSGRGSGPRWSSRHGGGGGGGSRSSRRAGGSGVKTEDGGNYVGGAYDISSDEGSDSGPRFSIDQINLAGDSDAEDYDMGKGKMPAKTQHSTAFRGLRPIRVERHEHVERSIGINTEASGSKSADLRREAKAKAKAKDDDDSLFVEEDEPEVDDVVMGDARAVRPTTEEAPRIKEEPTDDDAMITDNIPRATDDQAADKAELERQVKSKKKVSFNDPRSKLQTEEERREYDRHEEDIEYLKEALGSISTVDKAAAATEGEEGEKKDEPQQKYDRDGRLFLLQFPPITPNLVLPTPEQQDADQEAVVEVSQQQRQPGNPQAPGSVAVKKEDGTTTTATLPPPMPSTYPPTITATNTSLRPGRVGKLQVHQSGRTTIDWGGVSFELTKGSDVDFLQDAVVASDEKADAGAGEKRIWAMSQVSGKFVVTPDWETLLDE